MTSTSGLLHSVQTSKPSIYLDQPRLGAIGHCPPHPSTLLSVAGPRTSARYPHARRANDSAGRHALAGSSQDGWLSHLHSQTYRAVHARFRPVRLYVKRATSSAITHQLQPGRRHQAKQGARFDRLLCSPDWQHNCHIRATGRDIRRPCRLALLVQPRLASPRLAYNHLPSPRHSAPACATALSSPPRLR